MLDIYGTSFEHLVSWRSEKITTAKVTPAAQLAQLAARNDYSKLFTRLPAQKLHNNPTKIRQDARGNFAIINISTIPERKPHTSTPSQLTSFIEISNSRKVNKNHYGAPQQHEITSLLRFLDYRRLTLRNVLRKFY